MSAIGSALSGLMASSMRLDVSANNIVNQFSNTSMVGSKMVDKPYVPQVVDQLTLSTGGVNTILRDASPAEITAPDFDNPGGTQQLPNVDTAQELLNSNMAAYDFKANLKTLKAQDDMQKTLLDIIA